MNKPPEHLSDEAKALWESTLAAAPAEHFRRGDEPLLEAYCEAVADLRNIRSQWRDAGRPTTATHPNGAEGRHPLLTAVQSQSAAVASLAAKLRLCPSARISPQKAGTMPPPPDEGDWTGLLK